MPISLSRSRTEPRRVYFWDNERIVTNTPSDPVNISGFTQKILTFVSDTGGTLTIETDPYGDEDWDTYDTVTITAATREDYIFPDGMQHSQIRLSFSVTATMTGSISMR